MTLQVTLGRTNAKLTRVRRLHGRDERGFEVSVRGFYATAKLF